jgi:hypothetical protein
MSNATNETMNWTSAVTDLITLTQEGRLDWEYGSGPGQYLASLGDKEFRLTTREGLLLEGAISPMPGTSWSTVPGRLEVYSNSRLELRFPLVPALSGLTIAVTEYAREKAADVFDTIHNALKMDGRRQ